MTLFSAPRRRRADSVPRAALRLGARQPLGRARARTRLAAGDPRRAAGPPRGAEGRHHLHPRRGDRRGAPLPRRQAVRPHRGGAADARDDPAAAVLTPRRRILVVPKWYPWPDRPVFGAFCREHARALATRHDVVVLASLATPRPGFAAFRIEDSVEDGVRTVRVRYRRPFLRPAAMGFQLLGMLAARRRLRREGWRPDVVHVHVFEAAPPALILGRLTARRSRSPSTTPASSAASSTGYDRPLAEQSFERADLVAPVSEELAGHLRALAPRATFEVVPNVVDVEAFAPPATAAPSSAGPRLLNVAALAEKKGHRHLLAALTRAVRRDARRRRRRRAARRARTACPRPRHRRPRPLPRRAAEARRSPRRCAPPTCSSSPASPRTCRSS